MAYRLIDLLFRPSPDNDAVAVDYQRAASGRADEEPFLRQRQPSNKIGLRPELATLEVEACECGILTIGARMNMHEDSVFPQKKAGAFADY